MAKLNENQFNALNRIFKYYEKSNVYVDKEKYGIDLTPHRMFSFFLIGEFGPKRWYSYSNDLTQKNLKKVRLEGRSKLIEDPHGNFTSLAITITNIFQNYFHSHDSEWFTSPDIIRGIVAQIELDWTKSELCKYQYSNYALLEIANRIKFYVSLETDEYFYQGRSKRFIEVIREVKRNAVSTLKEAMLNYYNYGKVKQFKDIKRVATYNNEIILTIITSNELQNSHQGRYQDLIEFTLNVSRDISNMHIINNLANKKEYGGPLSGGRSHLLFSQIKETSKENLVISFLVKCEDVLNKALLELDNIKKYALSKKTTGYTTTQLRMENFGIPLNGNLIPDKSYHHSGIRKKQYFDRSSLEALIDIHKTFLMCTFIHSISLAIECYLEIYGEDNFNTIEEFRNHVCNFFSKATNRLINEINPNRALDELIYAFVRNNEDSEFLSSAKRKIAISPGFNPNGSLHLLKELVSLLANAKEYRNNINISGAEVGEISNFIKEHGGYLHNDFINDEIIDIVHTNGTPADMTMLFGASAALAYIVYKTSSITRFF
ncbi:hypothetical protein EDC55_10314 [Allofrancisella inopinata]|uniref:Uncharacterized protein n=1 Tax=Allofrancisella inopinata TaxID=1085647 RepID=A0AAE7CRB0_9GAMM|nr:hypothetical protein [Allofrancisella inopinata]QIV96692.1 hypothetical protein E4K63_07555 [Allofrancisella inopinata]TDT73445.1 hypothetical protein EDC55_10314 [Allofrancisella inopinata]